jgi:hypothetical protein
MTQKVYWTGEVPEKDDFGHPIIGIMYDAKTQMGPRATMSKTSYQHYGVGKLGTGLGQKYERQPDGKWLKVEG